MDLRVVKSGRAYHWPSNYGKDPVRGLAGTVIDLDAPKEREWAKGQEHKLEPAPEGAVPTPIKHPVALRAIEALSRKPAAPAEPAKPKVGGDMPAVDLPKTTKAKAS